MTIGIYGFGGLGREVYDTVMLVRNEADRIIFIDDMEKHADSYGVADILDFSSAARISDLGVVIAVGEPSTRIKLRQKVEAAGLRLHTVVHPTASISPFSHIDDGVYIGAGAMVSCQVRLHKNVFLQPQSIIGHDSVLGADTLLSSLSMVCGNCLVGDGCYIAPNCVIKQEVKIGNSVLVAFSSTVHRDIPDDVVVMGSPARAIARNYGRVFQD